MEFIEVAKTDGFSDGTSRTIEVSGKDLLIVNYKNNFYAIDRKCTHMGGDLSKGKLEGKIITCPRHGSKFDVTTGECTQGPKIGFVKLKTRDETAYEVKVDGNVIKVKL